jgi:hypothetical protein
MLVKGKKSQGSCAVWHKMNAKNSHLTLTLTLNLASQFLHKGSQLYIEGKINYRQYPEQRWTYKACDRNSSRSNHTLGQKIKTIII